MNGRDGRAPTEEEMRAAIVAAARTWDGTPFHNGQGVKDAGVDCLHLLYHVYVLECGAVPAFELPRYKPQWFLHRDEPLYLQGVAKYARRIELADVKAADFGMFNFGRHAAHGAIFIDSRTIIHAYQPIGRVVITDVDHIGYRLHSCWSVFP